MLFGKKSYSRYGVELDSRLDVVEIITKKNDRNHIMVKGSRTSVHDIVDRILLELAKKQYRHLRNIWQRNSQTEICYFIGGGSIVLKDYLKTLNNNLDGYNIDFFEDEKESVWMMANAYYKLISDFSKKNQRSKTDERRENWLKQNRVIFHDRKGIERGVSPLHFVFLLIHQTTH